MWSDDAPVHHVRIVGRAVLTPGARSFGNAADMGEGIYLTEAALRRFTPSTFDPPSPYIVAVRFRPGVTPAVGRAALERRLGGERKGWFVETPGTPETLVDFGNVRNLPLLLGGVLALIAAIGIAHLLVTSIRRRRHDLAILKTLGFVPAQVRRAIAWQATTLAVVALLIGVPLGIISGRLIWSVFADRVGVLAETVTPVLPRSRSRRARSSLRTSSRWYRRARRGGHVPRACSALSSAPATGRRARRRRPSCGAGTGGGR